MKWTGDLNHIQRRAVRPSIVVVGGNTLTQAVNAEESGFAPITTPISREPFPTRRIWDARLRDRDLASRFPLAIDKATLRARDKSSAIEGFVRGMYEEGDNCRRSR